MKASLNLFDKRKNNELLSMYNNYEDGSLGKEILNALGYIDKVYVKDGSTAMAQQTKSKKEQDLTLLRCFNFLVYYQPSNEISSITESLYVAGEGEYEVQLRKLTKAVMDYASECPEIFSQKVMVGIKDC